MRALLIAALLMSISLPIATRAEEAKTIEYPKLSLLSNQTKTLGEGTYHVICFGSIVNPHATSTLPRLHVSHGFETDVTCGPDGTIDLHDNVVNND